MNVSRRKEISNIISRLYKVQEELQNIKDEIERVRDDEEECFGNLPDSIQEGDRGLKMREGIDYLEEALSSAELEDTIDEIISNLTEAKGE